jgi:hypothetical protein
VEWNSRVTPAELPLAVREADVFKMSLGKSARYREEALVNQALIFQSEKRFHEAVLSGSEAEIRRTGRLLRTDNYPQGNGPDNAISIWRRSIETFRTLPRLTIVLHWESDPGYLHWGLTENVFALAREEVGDLGQPGLVFHRPLVGGWRKESIGGVPLSGLHPKARDYAVNMATLNRVQTDPGYFKALILDEDTAEWEGQPDWVTKARKGNWVRKDRTRILAERRRTSITPLVVETADHFQDEIRRMAATAIHTAAYANGQTVLAKVKNKDIGFTREELEEEIAAQLRSSGNRCALTGHVFRPGEPNPHLRPSLDRKDSARGYVPGNLQIVTRAANFYKSASDEADWALKAEALTRMALAMQRARKASEAAAAGGPASPPGPG